MIRVTEEIKKGTKQKYCFVPLSGPGEISLRGISPFPESQCKMSLLRQRFFCRYSALLKAKLSRQRLSQERFFSSGKDLSFPGVKIQNVAAKAAIFLQVLCAFESKAFNA
jgi:hypothetical protein